MTDPHAPHTPGETPHDVLGEVDKPSQLLVVYVVVLGLALANVALSSTGLGRYALLVQLGIATVQAGFVAYYFMHLRQGDQVVILTALASIFWVGILFVLFMADYMTRHLVVSG